MAHSMIRALKFLLLFLLICASVFLASFNLTLRHLIDQRRSAAALASERASDHEILSAEDEVEQVRDHIRENPDAPPGEFEPDPDGWKTRLPMTEEDHRVIRNQRFRAFEADERRDPTMGRYRTTTRPQDGYREAVARDDVGHPVKFKDRPEITSHGTGRAGERGVPDSTSGGTAAEAHFAQGLRMLSSRFDRMDGKGDALPPPLGSGEYRQADIGDGFVKVRPAKRRRNKRDRQHKSKSRHAEMFVEGMAGAEEQSDGHGSGGDFESFLGDFKAIALDKYDEWHDWILEVLGADDDRPEGGSGGGKHHHASSMSEERNEEDVFSLRDTKMGGQILWLCETVAGLWSRDGDDDGIGGGTGGDATDGNGTVSPGLSRQDVLAREGLRHISQAAELGHPAAQRMVANSLASGILPLSDHGMIVRAAREERRKRREGRGGPASENGGVGEDPARPTDPPLLPATTRLDVPDDFSSGGEQLSRAVVLWHMSAMSGDVESAMALGWRHMYSASGGDTSNSILQSADQISGGYDFETGAALPHRGDGRASSSRHYGVLGTCQTALAYYEAAAHGVMDELESGPTRGKISPPLDGHRLAEIYVNGGASVALSGNNKPDEVEEALQYYRMLASRSRSPEPDVMAAFTIANFYYFGLRGAKQDLRLAVKYYEIAGDYNHWEGGGRAGLMHVWGIGMTPDERDLGLAYKYFLQGTPGGLDNCLDRLRRKRQQAGKQDQTGAEEVSSCDSRCANGLGLLHLLGVPNLVKRDTTKARLWFEHGKDLGDPDAQYNYAMIRLGWMVEDEMDFRSRHNEEVQAPAFLFARQPVRSSSYVKYREKADHTSLMSELGSTKGGANSYNGPTASDFNIAMAELGRAATKGHLQAEHRLAMLHTTGAHVPPTGSKVVASSCTTALRHFKHIAESGHTFSRRNRAAWKQYNAGDYESSLRNYLASAETGSLVGQVNAAFLLEQGYCMGMSTKDCTNASVRLWRAAAQQGNLEASLRVGDFYYYGKMMKSRGREPSLPAEGDGEDEGDDQYLTDYDANTVPYMPGPFGWTRYILYPEELFGIASKWISDYVDRLKNGEDDGSSPADGGSTCSNEDRTCAPNWTEQDENALRQEEDRQMAIAAQYYRMAADTHSSARANYNLGFMHEWGLGLAQDFPLAKRHYDLAGKDASMAAAIALWAMNLHQTFVKFQVYFKDYLSV